MAYQRPAKRLDKLGADLSTETVPVLVSGFAQAIRDHEHQIADLVLSICARALSNGEASLETAVAAISAKRSSTAFHPQELLRSPYMEVHAIDSGIFADLLLTRAGASRTSGVAERTLEQYGWEEIRAFGSLVAGPLTPTERPSFHRSTIWAPRRSPVHRMTGARLYMDLRRRLHEQVENSRVLGLSHIFWHSTLTEAYLLDMRGELYNLPPDPPTPQPDHQRAPGPRRR